jgi:endonuclease YncB( thermonuclease family)
MPADFRGSKKAPWIGAFFALVAWQPSVLAASCAPPETTEPVRVRYVYDGDTLVLTDDRKIRLIGINAPETARNGQPAEALGVEARDRLRQMLFRQGNAARALYGVDRLDRHGRTLAHLWLPDGKNVSAEMLRSGMAWTVAVPPNVRLLDCYLASERPARAAGKGVWSHPELDVKPSHELDLRSRGFHRVSGLIMRVNRGGGATWINLQGRFAVRIPDEDLRWFERTPDRSWIGKKLQVRGWVYSAKGESRMTLRHPAALELQAAAVDRSPGSRP